jgi:hypothetical protein
VSFIHDLIGKFQAIRKRETAMDRLMVEYHQLEVKLTLARLALCHYAKHDHWDRDPHHVVMCVFKPSEEMPWARAEEAIEEIDSDDVGVVSSNSAWNPRKMEG